MPKIMVSGRGGSGKSTLVALLGKKLSEEGRVLIVDTDESNLGLALMLGIKPPVQTIIGYFGGKPTMRTKLLKSIQSEGKEEVRLFDGEITINNLPPEILSGEGPLSLVRVGKIEHAMEGCACPMGATARSFLNQLSVGEGSWVIVDNEAGIEHFGRGVLEGADMVLMVVDPSHEAVLLAEKAKMLSSEAGKAFCVIINKTDEQSRPILEEALSKRKLRTIGTIPYSRQITRANLTGESLQTELAVTDISLILGAIKSNLGIQES